MMKKKLKSEGGYNYFENLPDELVILIFTKLSSSEGKKTLDAIKSLGRSSQVSKRFNALTCLVPTLTIHDLSIPTLYDYCPKILNKFKHIRSLHVGHVISDTQMLNPDKHSIVTWEVTMDGPHKYYIAVVACTDMAIYEDPQAQKSLRLDSNCANEEFMNLTIRYCVYLFSYHHMLLSSIKDHKFLQSVVITELTRRQCTLTLDEDILVKLRNCGSMDLEKVKGRVKVGSVANMDIPVAGMVSAGVLMNNVCFSIMRRWEKSMDDDNDIHKDDDNDFKVKDRNLLNMALYRMLENPEAASVIADDEIVLRNLLLLKSVGNLF